MKYEIQINLVNEVCASVHYLFFHVRFTWWHYQSLLALLLCRAFPPCLVVPITRLHHSNFHAVSLGRSRSLNTLVSRHGSLSGGAWLHYDEDSRDVIFCHPCVTALSRNKVKWGKGESAFGVSRGYSNWKDAIMAYKKHAGGIRLP